MQRTVPTTFANGRQQQPQTAAMSLAQRIRNEQGPERARAFLMAMEPFLAPMERQHIAEQMGVQLPRTQENSYSGGAGPAFAQQAAGMGGMGGMGNMGNTMQMMQMLSALSGKAPQQQTAGGMDPMLMAQLLGGIMGKK